jgi:hypothetical protein
MNSSNGKVQAVTDGTTTRQADQEKYSVGALRRKEAQGLIELTCESVHMTSQLAYQIHKAIYGDLDTTPLSELRERLFGALTCMETADHYLRMLEEALADIPRPVEDQGEPPF